MMSHSNPKNLRLLTLSALMTAVIALTTAFLFHIPIGTNGGYLHFGDAFIYLTASLLPTPYALATASIGGGLADLMSGVPIWILPTMIIKPLCAACFTAKSDHLLCRRNLFALVGAGVITNLLYYLAEVILTGSYLAPLAIQWGNVIQALGSAVVFFIVAAALDRSGITQHLKSTLLKVGSH